MLLFEFTSFLTALSNYYERKPPTPGTAELWFEKVKRVPAESLKWIETSITSSNEIFPKNLPNVVWACFRAWQDAHPEKRETKYEISCADGCDAGVLHVRKDREFGGQTFPSIYAFACARCNRGPVGYPHARLRDLEAAGYEIDAQRPHGAGYFKRLNRSAGIKSLARDLTGQMAMDEKQGQATPPISVENSRHGVAIQFSGVETMMEPSEEEIEACGADFESREAV